VDTHSKTALPNATKHGLNAMKHAMKQFGSRAIDRRTSTGKALEAWRRELVADLGGNDTVSSSQLVVIDAAVRTKLLLDSVDTWLLQQKSVVNHRKRSVYPVVLQRQQLSDALVKYMQTLGLKREPKAAKTLNALMDEPPSVPI
jgi:hypothetical protein